jgi:hypothetical protein
MHFSGQWAGLRLATYQLPELPICVAAIAARIGAAQILLAIVEGARKTCGYRGEDVNGFHQQRCCFSCLALETAARVAGLESLRRLCQNGSYWAFFGVLENKFDMERGHITSKRLSFRTDSIAGSNFVLSGYLPPKLVSCHRCTLLFLH